MVAKLRDAGCKMLDAGSLRARPMLSFHGLDERVQLPSELLKTTVDSTVQLGIRRALDHVATEIDRVIDTAALKSVA